MKKTAILCSLLVLIAFLVILLITGALGQVFGKKVEIIALVIIAIGLAGFLLLDRRKGD
jgi:positive regulator of sigma E activity